MDYLHGADTRECLLTEEFTLSGKMADEELIKKRKIREGHKGYVTTTLEKVKALLDEFEPPLVNQLKTYRIARTENLNVLVALDDEILSV